MAECQHQSEVSGTFKHTMAGKEGEEKQNPTINLMERQGFEVSVRMAL